VKSKDDVDSPFIRNALSLHYIVDGLAGQQRKVPIIWKACASTGRPNQGVASELKGERVRIYGNEALAANLCTSNPRAFRLNIPGLPANYLPVFATGRTAFVQTGERIVAHGGMSVEELIVPFIKVSLVSGTK